MIDIGTRARVLAHRGMAAKICLLLIVEVSVFLLTPFIYRYLIDDVLYGGRFEMLLPVLAVYFISYFITVGAGFLKGVNKAALSEAVTSELRGELYKKLKQTSLYFQEKTDKNGVLATLISEVPEFVRANVDVTIDSVGFALRICVGTALLFIINAKMLLVILLSLPPFFLITRFFGRFIERATVGYNALREQYIKNVSEGLGGAEEIITFKRQSWDGERVSRVLSDMIPNRRRAEMSSRASGDISFLFYWLVVILLYYFGGIAHAEGSMTVGDIILYTQYMDNIYSPIRGIVDLISKRRSAAATEAKYQGMVSLFERDSAGDAPGAADCAGRARGGSLVMRNVVYRYPEGHFTLSVSGTSFAGGGAYALLGKSGEGKTTLIKLAAGLYAADSGEISYGGREITARELAGRAVLCLQNPFLFDLGGVADNIFFSGAQSSDFSTTVISALEIDKYIASGIDELSGGQR